MKSRAQWRDPALHLAKHQPDEPTLYFCPEVLHATYARFVSGFDGLVTYAVKANESDEVLSNLVAAGMDAFDVASPAEMRAVRALNPDAALHYNNPVRSRREVEIAREMRIASASVDRMAELDKLGRPEDFGGALEVSVRIKLPVKGAAYDFGAKFGAEPDVAVALLKDVAARGFTPSICFHVGTQCEDPAAWTAYIAASADVARRAGVTLERLNVGGGFPAHRDSFAPDLEVIFDRIHRDVAAHFDEAPALLCEPGRAMVAESFLLAARVKAVFDTPRTIFLNDGVYGGLSEARDIGTPGRITTVCAEGTPRLGQMHGYQVFGPTCDSLDAFNAPVLLPDTLREGDYLLFPAMGAYSLSIATRFNGYGLGDPVTVDQL